MTSMTWSITCNDADLNGKHGKKVASEALEEVLDKLKLTDCDLGKTLKLAEKLATKAMSVDPVPSSRFQASLNDLSAIIEKAVF